MKRLDSTSVKYQYTPCVDERMRIFYNMLNGPFDTIHQTLLGYAYYSWKNPFITHMEKV